MQLKRRPFAWSLRRAQNHNYGGDGGEPGNFTPDRKSSVAVYNYPRETGLKISLQDRGLSMSQYSFLSGIASSRRGIANLANNTKNPKHRSGLISVAPFHATGNPRSVFGVLVRNIAHPSVFIDRIIVCTLVVYTPTARFTKQDCVLHVNPPPP